MLQLAWKPNSKTIHKFAQTLLTSLSVCVFFVKILDNPFQGWGGGEVLNSSFLFRFWSRLNLA